MKHDIDVRPDLSVPVCPTWCSEEKSHPFECVEGDREIRHHNHKILDLEIPDGYIIIDVTVEESRRLDGSDFKTTEATVDLVVDRRPGEPFTHLDGDQSQVVADAMHAASVKLDEIKAGAK